MKKIKDIWNYQNLIIKAFLILSIIPTINKIFSENNIVRDKFELVKEFPILGDLKFYCYERKNHFDIEEGNYWKDKFTAQTELYPKLFGERIEKYMSNY